MFLLRCLARLLPRIPITQSGDPNELSNDTEMVSCL